MEGKAGPLPTFAKGLVSGEKDLHVDIAGRQTPLARGYSGHTFRVTVAMYLASCGVDVGTIHLHGRWGSRAVLAYVQLPPIGSVSIAGSLTG